MRETHTARISRSPLTRSQTTSRKARRSSFSLSTPPVVEEKLERRTSSAKNNQRAPSIFSAIFGLPKPVEPVPEKQYAATEIYIFAVADMLQSRMSDLSLLRHTHFQIRQTRMPTPDVPFLSSSNLHHVCLRSSAYATQMLHSRAHPSEAC